MCQFKGGDCALAAKFREGCPTKATACKRPAKHFNQCKQTWTVGEKVHNSLGAGSIVCADKRVGHNNMVGICYDGPGKFKGKDHRYKNCKQKTEATPSFCGTGSFYFLYCDGIKRNQPTNSLPVVNSEPVVEPPSANSQTDPAVNMRLQSAHQLVGSSKVGAIMGLIISFGLVILLTTLCYGLRPFQKRIDARGEYSMMAHVQHE